MLKVPEVLIRGINRKAQGNSVAYPLGAQTISFLPFFHQRFPQKKGLNVCQRKTAHRNAKVHKKCSILLCGADRPKLSGLPHGARKAPLPTAVLETELSSYFIYSTRNDADDERSDSLYANHMQRVNKWETQRRRS